MHSEQFDSRDRTIRLHRRGARQAAILELLHLHSDCLRMAIGRAQAQTRTVPDLAARSLVCAPKHSTHLVTHLIALLLLSYLIAKPRPVHHNSQPIEITTQPFHTPQASFHTGLVGQQ